MDCLFDDEIEWITETLNIGDYNIKLRAIEPDYGQIDACLSQVLLLEIFSNNDDLGEMERRYAHD